MTGNDGRKGNAKLIIALATGSTVKDAAKAAAVSEATVRRRLRDPGFVEAVTEERAAIIRRAVAMLASASTEAVSTLRKLLNASSDTVRLGASRAILELGSKLRESEELEQRIAALEQSMKERGGR